MFQWCLTGVSVKRVVFHRCPLRYILGEMENLIRYRRYIFLSLGTAGANDFGGAELVWLTRPPLKERV